MELLTIVGVISQRRFAVALGLPFAVLVGLLLAGMLPFGPGPATTPGRGLAETRVLLDHRTPIVADLGAISDTLGTQAALLAEVMGGDTTRDAIARGAGIRPADLLIRRPQVAQLFAPGLLSQRTTEAVADLPAASVIAITAASPIPVLTIDVNAPTRDIAQRIATAAREMLRTVMAERAPTRGRALVVRPLGAVRAVALPASTRSPLVAVAAALFAFVFWVCSVVVLHGVLRVWRQASAAAATA
jgi:hypothetical protein